ncbi:MAG: DUF3750 domain-containing protein [Bdellovibrionaceae bacterium]|nr:DUF3750 domain-containing protein [Pseudobdellovibrionaceae bacterium]
MILRIFKYFLVVSLLLLSACTTSNWRTASRESAKIAPLPKDLKESIFQIYAARAFSWRGYFATHPWVAWKKVNEHEYTVAQVTSWGLGRGEGSAVTVVRDIPDRYWYGNEPKILFEVRGEKAERMIARVQDVIENYPYRKSYTLWPGPNSNTFVAYIIRSTPEITVELPPHAIGKDYLINSNIFALSPSGSGVQMSLFGLLGFTIGLAEGIEINILSMTFGIDILRPALKLPFYGRLGMDDKPL